MTRFFISALALLGMGVMATEASAQMYIIKDGKVKVALDYTPDYITFENPMLCGGVIGEAVDMGLSVKWSSVNVGASSPEQSGNYYSWGETETKEDYFRATYKHGGTFIGDNKTTLEKVDDVAAANWGGDWAMPSQADWEEIYFNCSREWTTQNGVNGYKITGSNGNTIFLPAAGYREYGSLYGEGSDGIYWSSSLNELHSSRGRNLGFDSDYFGPWYSDSRCKGYSVRPVCPSAGNTNGHVAVDLGLPSGKLWAECNVGASTPEASGDYFAWGETEAKEYYYWSTYKYIQSGKSKWYYINKYQAEDHQFDGVWYKDVKYCNQGDKKTTLEAKDDVATQSWGSEWRIPTAAEWAELYNNTTQTWTNDYEGTGVKGYILTCTKEGYEGVSIFLPAAGYRDYGNLSRGDGGYYWSSSLDEDNSSYGRYLDFNEGGFYPLYGYDRYGGQSVRPVCPSAEP
ncbi:MAG: hypothetical protein MJZ31_04945 [Bacteroidales bacterium]|nr:hypothetical protein [Bacteroidales bacterium]